MSQDPARKKPEVGVDTSVSRSIWESGWGPDHDQPNPIKRLGQRLVRDATETVQDLRDEPQEVPYRLRERARGYVPRWYQHLKENQ